jgi:hypothetical protein
MGYTVARGTKNPVTFTPEGVTDVHLSPEIILFGLFHAASTSAFKRPALHAFGNVVCPLFALFLLKDDL